LGYLSTKYAENFCTYPLQSLYLFQIRVRKNVAVSIFFALHLNAFIFDIKLSEFLSTHLSTFGASLLSPNLH
jgi:hypothetical protein